MKFIFSFTPVVVYGGSVKCCRAWFHVFANKRILSDTIHAGIWSREGNTEHIQQSSKCTTQLSKDMCMEVSLHKNVGDSLYIVILCGCI